MKNWQRLKSDFALQKNLIIREKIIASIREFFSQKKYREIDVPLLAPALPAESYVEIFKTVILDSQRRSQPAYLTTSPEVFLKKLLVSGIGSCFVISKSFRNTESQSNLHNPEFTILEWYQVDADYQVLIDETEALFTHIFKNLFPGKPQFLKYQKQQIDLTPPWERISMSQAFKKYAKVDLEKILNLGSIRELAQSRGYQVEPDSTWEELFNQIFLNEIIKHLGRKKPTFLYDYPSQLAALAAKRKTTDSRFAERYEVIINGLEIADGCTELTQWKEQESRIKKETYERKRMGKDEYVSDQEFIEALQQGLPKCAGVALGVDRLVMLFCDVKDIKDVLYFPASDLWPQT